MITLNILKQHLNFRFARHKEFFGIYISTFRNGLCFGPRQFHQYFALLRKFGECFLWRRCLIILLFFFELDCHCPHVFPVAHVHTLWPIRREETIDHHIRITPIHNRIPIRSSFTRALHIVTISGFVLFRRKKVFFSLLYLLFRRFDFVQLHAFHKTAFSFND